MLKKGAVSDQEHSFWEYLRGKDKNIFTRLRRGGFTVTDVMEAPLRDILDIYGMGPTRVVRLLCCLEERSFIPSWRGEALSQQIYAVKYQEMTG